MLKKFIFSAAAIVSIAASATADAKPRHHKQHAVQATIVCGQHGCSDRRISHHSMTVRHTARVSEATSRTKVRFAHRHRTAGIKRAAVVRSATVRHVPRTAQAGMVRKLRSDVRQVRTSRERVETVIICNQQGCSDRVMPRQVTAARAEATRHASASSVYDANGNTVVVGGRPAGCPHRFCGCEASRYLFGEIRPELNLAYNWIRKFPRTSPAPGMAAARSGHVMVLISHAGGNDWLVHDGNSGGGLTRDHVMSISRYVIVDPRGSRSALR